MSGHAREHTAATEAAQLVELRVILAQTTAELGRLRADMAPLTALPVQLDALSKLWQEQLDNVKEHQRRDVRELRRDMDEVARDVTSLEQWQTWALRLVVGLVVMAVLSVVVVAQP